MTERDEVAMRGVRVWLDVAALAGLTDRELLDRYAAGGGHAAQVAFAALVARHGPMVLRACRAGLRDGHDAEDAFQATFLVLVRRCGTLWVRESLGPWLHRVASRVAIRAQAAAIRRERHERQASASRVEAREGSDPQDIGPILHAEIDRLPERYRGPVVLCDLEGRTHEEAAEQLGCPIGTVKSRLSRARERLRLRLARRGVIPAAGGLGTLLTEQAASAVSSKLALATAEAANHFAASGNSDAGTVPAAVATLAEGVVKAMALNKLAIQCLALLLGVFVTTGVLVLAADRPTAKPEPGANTLPVKASPLRAAPVPPVKPIPKELQPFQGYWQMTLCDSLNGTLSAKQQEVLKWRWTVKGDEIVWGRQGEEWKLTLKVDPAKKPMEIDLTYLSGPFKDKTCLGMYEWGGVDGKTLMISIQDPGADVPRPNGIRMTSTSKNSLIFLRKTEPVDPEKELTSLQGTWTFDIVQTDPTNGWPKPIGKGPDNTGQGSERRWVIKGKEITWTDPDGKEIKVSFTIDPYKVPRHIDMAFLSGPHKGEKCQGVYERGGLNDQMLWLCIVDPGKKADRPKDISYEGFKGRSMIGLVPYDAKAEGPAWKAEFRKAYGLKDGELIRRVPPPYPACRAEYFKDRAREFSKRNKLDLPADVLNQDHTDHFTKFGWKDGWMVDNLTMQSTPVKPDEGLRLVQLIRMTTGFRHTRTEGDAGLLEQKVTGDFVVRVDVDPAKLAAALGTILRKECGLNVSLAVNEVERDAYVLSGKYASRPLPDREKGVVEIYGFELTDRTTGGGGSGSLREMADNVEGFIGIPVVVGEVEGVPKRVEWHFNSRSPATDLERAQDTDADSVLKNLTAQTGLTAKWEKRKVSVLTVKKGE